MYTKDQLKLIEQLWVGLWPVSEIAKQLQKTPIAISEKIKNMQLPERDHHLVRMLNFHGRELLRYGNTREQVRAGLKQEHEKHRIDRIVGRADRQQVALDYLKYQMDHGHNKIQAIKRAYNRDASASKIAKALKMNTRDVTAIVRGK